MMDYTEMIKETNELVRRVMLHNDIASWALMVLVGGLILMIGWLALQEHREKMRQYKAQREWEEMQIAMNQQTYYRM